ncbi:MAG: hypothetical protein V7K23_26570 [Nostoc sp.]
MDIAIQPSVEAWIKQLLIPTLQPGQVVVMDNASFHKSTARKRND